MKKYFVDRTAGDIGCSAVGGCNQADSFVPLPPQSTKQYPMNQLVQTIGDTEQVRMQAPFASVEFGQTGSFAGGLKLEEICLKQKTSAPLCCLPPGVHGLRQRSNVPRHTTRDVYWVAGSRNHSPMQHLSMVARLPVLHHQAQPTYVRVHITRTGWNPHTHKYLLFRRVGLNKHAVCLWHCSQMVKDLITSSQTSLGGVLGESHWAIWASSRRLNRADLVLRSVTPSIQVIDHDSVGREFIGRQSGFTIVRQGLIVGTIDLTYANTWGQMPNTTLISRGHCPGSSGATMRSITACQYSAQCWAQSRHRCTPSALPRNAATTSPETNNSGHYYTRRFGPRNPRSRVRRI